MPPNSNYKVYEDYFDTILD